MTVSTAARATLAGGLLAAAIGLAASPADAKVPAAGAKLRAAIVEQRAALRALPRAGQSLGPGYKRSLAHVNAALTRLRAAQAALVDAARTTGPLPNADGIQRLLDLALFHDGHAATELGEALWFMARGVSPVNTSAGALRADLRSGLHASTALAKLVG